MKLVNVNAKYNHTMLSLDYSTSTPFLATGYRPGIYSQLDVCTVSILTDFRWAFVQSVLDFSYL